MNLHLYTFVNNIQVFKITNLMTSEVMSEVAEHLFTQQLKFFYIFYINWLFLGINFYKNIILTSLFICKISFVKFVYCPQRFYLTELV